MMNQVRAINPEEVNKILAEPVQQSLQKTRKRNSLTFGLIFSDQGIIYIPPGMTITDVCIKNGINLNSSNLQQVQLFNPKKELHLWKTSSNPPDFAGCWMTDGKKKRRGEQNWFDEKYILKEGDWGKVKTNPLQKKIIVKLGAPFKKKKEETNKVTFLEVRHYLEEDDDGQLYIGHSRLIGISEGEEKST